MRNKSFDMLNFEQSLKDHADQFTMIPSKKVWHGLYNDLHPGSKWPSIVIAIVFLITLVGIGHLNNSDSGFLIPKQIASENNNSGKTIISGTTAATESLKDQAILVNPKSNKIQNVQPDLIKKNSAEKLIINVPTINSENKELSISDNNVQPILKNIQGVSGNEITNTDNFSNQTKSIAITQNTENNLGNVDKSWLEINHPQYLNGLVKNEWENSLIVFKNELSSKAQGTLHSVSSMPTTERNVDQNAKKNGNQESNETENNNTIENTKASHSNIVRKKKNANIDWTFFVTPTIASVIFNRKNQKPILYPPSLSPIVVLPNQVSFNMMYTPKFGFETGAEMTYALNKKWAIVSGARISYSGYTVIADNVHPTFAKLYLQDKSGFYYPKSYFTHYGNGQAQNQIKLNNFILQASVPVGLQLELFGNENIDINLSSTIEPTFVINSKAFLLSTNGRNYVSDPSLNRVINLNSSLGTFITFKTKKFKWHVGPSVRYQWLSTYKKLYPVNEHLVEYGIRFGISK